MYRQLLILLTALMFSGCGWGFYSGTYGSGLYLFGEYGYIGHDEPLFYYYGEHYENDVYFETPYLDYGCRVYLNISGHDDAWLSYDEYSLDLYDYSYDYGTSYYTFEVVWPGRQELHIETYDRYGDIEFYYDCR